MEATFPIRIRNKTYPDSMVQRYHDDHVRPRQCICLRKAKKVDPTIILINLLFFTLSMTAGQFKILLPSHLAFLHSLPVSGHQNIDCSNASDQMDCGYTFLTYFVATNIYFTIYFSKPAWFGSAIMDSVPAKEVAFIKGHKLPGPFFNDYLTGGYMIWRLYPEYKVFIDPRYGPFVNGVVGDWFELKSKSTPDELDELTTKYGFKAALINLREQKIISLFLHSPRWKLIYFDKTAAVIVLKSFYEEHDSQFSSVDLSPSRFRDIDDPSILMNLFSIYIKTAGPHELKEIASFYRNNVRNSYAFKKDNLQVMEFDIKILEEKAKWTNPMSNKIKMAE